MDVERGRREAGGCGCGSSVVVLVVVVVWWTLQSTGRQAGKARQAVAALCGLWEETDGKAGRSW